MIENMKVRRFKEEDAQEVRNLIVRNFLEVNSKEYGISAMEKFAKAYDAEKVLNVASYAHMYVFEFDGKIIDYLLLFQPCLLKLFQSVMMPIIQFLNTIFVIISKFSIKFRCCNRCWYLNSACSYIKFIRF